MADKRSEKAQTVPIVEADILDEMNETNGLIAERAFEIYESRNGGHGADQDDWFTAEGEILPKLEIDFDVTERAIRFTARPIRLGAKDLEVIIGHRRAVICGLDPGPARKADGSNTRKIMRIVELPFEVDPVSARAILQNETLQVMLPRLKAEDAQFSAAAGR